MFPKDYRARARQALTGKWPFILPVVLLAQLIMGGVVLDLAFDLFCPYELYQAQAYTITGQESISLPMPTVAGVIYQILSILYSLLTICFTIGQYRALDTLLDGGIPSAGQLFHRLPVFRAMGVILLTGLIALAAFMPAAAIFMLLGSLSPVIAALLVMPVSIIPLSITLSYTMALYLLARNPEMGVMQALRESRDCMKGNRMALVGLMFSFLGWMLLQSLLLNGAARLLANLPGGDLAYSVIAFVASIPLFIYQITAEVAFFRSVLDGSRAYRSQWQQYQRENEVRQEADVAPEGEDSRPRTDLSVDEATAKNLFLQHKCSRRLMEKAGLLAEYEALNPSAFNETRWRRDYADSLMRRFDQDPGLLDDILALSAEYGMDELATRALQRIDRHIRQATLPDVEILNMCGRFCVLLQEESFAGQSGFIARRKEQIADMVNRLEPFLQENHPDGDWHQTLNLIRSMCR